MSLFQIKSLALAMLCTACLAEARAAGIFHARGSEIVDADGQVRSLHGFNLGGWFVMEPFMSPMDRTHRLKDSVSVMRTLESRFGRETARRLIAIYQQSWINDGDIARIAKAGFNAVRIPVWWGLFLSLDDPTLSGWRQDAFADLDRIVAACRSHGIVAIIDMHGVVGGQSDNPDTGQAGENRFWTDPTAQSATAWLWGRIAAHYRDDPAVAGYDLVNEPDPPKGMAAKEAVWSAYDRLYQAVRSADPEHMIFVEDSFGSWSLDMLPPPSRFGWTNIVYESHVYPWARNHPGVPQAEAAERSAERAIEDAARHRNWNVPIYIGEFSALDTAPGTWKAMIGRFDAAGLSWTIWSYKATDRDGTPNFWGYVEPTVALPRPDPSTDDAETIRRDWSAWRTAGAFAVNPALR
jgi:endoglucanase